MIKTESSRAHPSTLTPSTSRHYLILLPYSVILAVSFTSPTLKSLPTLHETSSNRCSTAMLSSLARMALVAAYIVPLVAADDLFAGCYTNTPGTRQVPPSGPATRNSASACSVGYFACTSADACSELTPPLGCMPGRHVPRLLQCRDKRMLVQ